MQGIKIKCPTARADYLTILLSYLCHPLNVEEMEDAGVVDVDEASSLARICFGTQDLKIYNTSKHSLCMMMFWLGSFRFQVLCFHLVGFLSWPRNIRKS